MGLIANVDRKVMKAADWNASPLGMALFFYFLRK
jgi:hypothetical protein